MGLRRPPRLPGPVRLRPTRDRLPQAREQRRGVQSGWARCIQRHLVWTRRARDRVLHQQAQREAEQTQALAASAREPIAAALVEHFAIFRRPVPPPASIKPLPRRAAVVIANQGYGLNVTQARFVPYPGTPGYWVIPGSQGISMAQIRPHGDGGGGNVPVSMALSGGMITTTCCNPGETVWGLVPDGDRTVTVVLAGAATRTVPVIDNVYSITVTGRITAIIAKDAGGRRITIKAPG